MNVYPVKVAHADDRDVGASSYHAKVRGKVNFPASQNHAQIPKMVMTVTIGEKSQ